MGNTSIKCVQCKQLKKEYSIKKLSTSTTELFVYPVSFLGISYIQKGNTQTDIYLCSNGHKIIKKSKCT